jgi:hypothetical protein
VPRLFSAYVIVDWSAAAKPTTGADSIWIGVLKRDVRFRMAFESFNPPTRAEAEKRLNAVLDDLKKRASGRWWASTSRWASRAGSPPR